MKKKNIIYILLAVFLANTAACEDVDKDEIYKGRFEKILFLAESGTTDITLYKTGEDTDYEISVAKSGTMPETTASGRLQAMTNEEYAKYTEATGVEYLKLPSDCYLLENAEMDFMPNERFKTVKLTMHTSRIDEVITAGKEYVIPLILKSERDSVNAEKNILLLKTQVVIPSVSFKESGLIPQYVGKGKASFEIPLEIQIENKWDFTCKVKVDAAAAQGHPLLSKGYVLENEGVVTFSKGNNLATLKVNIDRDAAGLNEVSREVKVLPLIIESISMSGFVINSKPHLMGVSCKYPLTVSMLSTNAQEPSEGAIPDMIDGSIGTYFHSAWSIQVDEPHYFQVTLPEAVSSFAFTYVNRSSNGNAAMKRFKVEVSDNGKDFTLLKEYSQAVDNLPTGAAGEFNSVVLTPDKPINNIRFICLENWTGKKFFVWSEFRLYAL